MRFEREQGAVGTLSGRVLDGRYRLEEQIARGGMATVHRATDLRLDRTVAVKVMHDGLAHDDDFVRRFGREARAAARLTHPGVVSVHDTGDDHGTLYLVMELVQGRTLRQLVREEAPLTPARALRLVESVLEALAAAHAAGIVHRDVKPENVLVTRAHDVVGGEVEQVKVADFGLSRAVSSETQHTATGEVLIGTVSYLSPELVVDGRADARADVYATGVVLFELLTASKPHQADSPIQVAYKHVHEDVPPPSSRADGIPDYLDALVARATARAVELRPADARVLLRQVRQVRIAVEQGVTHDSELTADLSPAAAAARSGVPASQEVLEETGTDELPDILTAREALGDDLDLDVDLGLVEESREHTTAVPPWLPEQRAPEATGPLEVGPHTGPGAPRRTQRRASRRRGPLLLVLVLVLAVAAGAGGWWYGVARWTDTPSVLGLTQAAAADKLDGSGLRLAAGDPAYDEGVPEGEVLSTSPAPGERVLDAGTVTVVLSLGPERYDVPDVAGDTLDDAQQQLADTNLGFGSEVPRYHPTVPEGRVIRTDPATGTSLRRDAAVDVVVSRGPRPIPVPDWTGRDAERAEAALTERGFEVTTTEEHSDTVGRGDVISQSPDSGTLVKGDEVAMVVSLGPVMVDVPRVVGDGVAAATAQLRAAGFRVETQRSSVYIGVQYVVSQSPSGGSAPRGSTIVIGIV